MQTIQVQGVHHITLTGADRQGSVDFWQGVLGMPLVFEQPNLEDATETHLYFDPGDGRLVTVFCNDARVPGRRPPPGTGAVHHLALTVSRATFALIPARLEARGIAHSGPKDRGFMDSIYFREPLGLRIECACYRFEPPAGATHVQVLARAHRLRLAAGDSHIQDRHLSDAIAALVAGG
jgi:catechol 2,3-dioxygenase-like lactoylglutathione lyase family enzyme